jgi:hypothetical protein
VAAGQSHLLVKKPGCLRPVSAVGFPSRFRSILAFHIPNHGPPLKGGFLWYFADGMKDVLGGIKQRNWQRHGGIDFLLSFFSLCIVGLFLSCV